MASTTELMRISPVIPVVTVPENTDAKALGEALIAGGVGIIEVTLRTATALDTIADLVKACPDLCVGAGTVWTEAQAEAVIDAGVEFMVSPGISMPVFDVAVERNIPLLPGAQTVTEVAHWQACGLSAVKFFPASIAGGISALKAFSAVFPGLEFCPTGGINEGNVTDYLALPQVTCVGGSWVVPQSAIAEGDWTSIQQAAAKVAAL